MTKRYIYTSVEEPEVIHDSERADLTQALVYNDTADGFILKVAFARVGVIESHEVAGVPDRRPEAFNPRVVQLMIAPEATKLATALVALDFMARRALGKTLTVFKDDMDRALLFTLSERMREQLDIIDKWCEENDA